MPGNTGETFARAVRAWRRARRFSTLTESTTRSFPARVSRCPNSYRLRIDAGGTSPDSTGWPDGANRRRCACVKTWRVRGSFPRNRRVAPFRRQLSTITDAGTTQRPRPTLVVKLSANPGISPTARRAFQRHQRIFKQSAASGAGGSAWESNPAPPRVAVSDRF